MRTVYLIRHGKPDFPNGRRMCIGRTDLPLSQEGLQQAEYAASLLKEKSFSVFSSPLIRARQTAQAFGRPVSVVEDFQELYAGEWDGLDFDTIRARYPELYEVRREDKTIGPPGGESNEDGLRRFSDALQKCMKCTCGDLAVVGHGGIMALFLKEVTGVWEKPGYGEIVTLEYENGIFWKREVRGNA